jgi:hypothetical protein
MARYLFVTGKLAAQPLRRALERLSSHVEWELAVLPISVAALMDARFVAGHLTSSMGCDQVMVPGLCKGDLKEIEDKLSVEVVRGPNSLKDLPAYFGQIGKLEGYGNYRTKIIAEIVDAHQLSLEV